MITIKQRKLIGVILIGCGVLVFYPFLQMSIRAALDNPNILENISITFHVFFFTTWLFFHIPAYVLIILGIYFLTKKENNKNSSKL